MTDWVSLAQAVAWPTVALIGILAFWRPLRNSLEQATELKIAGQEIRFTRVRLDNLEALIQRMERVGDIRDEVLNSEASEEIVAQAKDDPLVALTKLDIRIKREIRLLALANGYVEDIDGGIPTLWFQFVVVNRQSGQGPESLPALFMFSELLDAALKGSLPLSETDALRLARFGLRIHAYICAMPKRVNLVVEPNLDVYIDSQGTVKRPDITATLFRLSLPGQEDELRLCPTRAPYERDSRVTWEFDSRESWNENWVRHTQTGEIIKIWENSYYTFVGREWSAVG